MLSFLNENRMGWGTFNFIQQRSPTYGSLLYEQAKVKSGAFDIE